MNPIMRWRTSYIYFEAFLFRFGFDNILSNHQVIGLLFFSFDSIPGRHQHFPYRLNRSWIDASQIQRYPEQETLHKTSRFSFLFFMQSFSLGYSLHFRDKKQWNLEKKTQKTFPLSLLDMHIE